MVNFSRSFDNYQKCFLFECWWIKTSDQAIAIKSERKRRIGDPAENTHK